MNGGVSNGGNEPGNGWTIESGDAFLRWSLEGQSKALADQVAGWLMELEETGPPPEACKPFLTIPTSLSFRFLALQTPWE